MTIAFRGIFRERAKAELATPLAVHSGGRAKAVLSLSLSYTYRPRRRDAAPLAVPLCICSPWPSVRPSTQLGRHRRLAGEEGNGEEEGISRIRCHGEFPIRRVFAPRSQTRTRALSKTKIWSKCHDFTDVDLEAGLLPMDAMRRNWGLSSSTNHEML